jgi:hypothetical protein
MAVFGCTRLAAAYLGLGFSPETFKIELKNAQTVSRSVV